MPDASGDFGKFVFGARRPRLLCVFEIFVGGPTSLAGHRRRTSTAFKPLRSPTKLRRERRDAGGAFGTHDRLNLAHLLRDFVNALFDALSPHFVFDVSGATTTDSVSVEKCARTIATPSTT